MQVKVNQAEKRSWLEVDLNQIVSNLRIYQQALPRDVSIMAVIKADAYGHGDARVAKTLIDNGVDMFAVSNIDEAVGLRKAGIRGLILILGYTSPIYAEELYKYDLTQAIVSEEYALALSERGYRVKCQFAVDTGMNRIGLPFADAVKIETTIMRYCKVFDVNGIFTHLCVADSDNVKDIDFTWEQLRRFKVVADAVSNLNLPYVHCLNTAGGLRYSKNKDYASICKIARLGIGLYGLKPDENISFPNGIKPAITWKSIISMVKKVGIGESLSYGRTFMTKRPSIIATVTTGYADGYNRLLSNSGFVMIKGKKAPIVGRICMDQTLIDVTDVSDVKMGDVVVLMGDCDGLHYDANDMAADLQTIGYEVICDISKRVQRFYL